MALSARNQLAGWIKEVNLGNVMAHIVVQVGDNEMESVITRRSAEEMKLKLPPAGIVVVRSYSVRQPL